MIVKIMPDQVPDFWELIKYTKAESDPMKPTYMPDRMNNLLNECLIGDVDVWIVLAGDNSIVGCILTKFYKDTINGTNDLCIYGFASAPDRDIGGEQYGEMFNTITKYARKHRCTQIIAYTDNIFLTDMAMSTKKAYKKDYLIFNILDDWSTQELSNLKRN